LPALSRPQPRTFVAGVAGAWLLAGVAVGDVLPEHSGGPFNELFGFPHSADGSGRLEAGDYDIDLLVVSASHNIDEQRGTEYLVLDGESTRLDLAYRYGVGNRLQLGITLPYVWHHSGNLDAVIDGWHDFFGLPGGPREERPHDVLDLRYADAGDTLVALNRNVRGPGDVRLHAGWQLAAGDASRTMLRIGVKLPTGDSTRLTGSGNTDLSIGIGGDAWRLAGTERFSGFYRADLVRLGTPEVLRARRRDFVGQLSAGMGFRASPTVQLRMQMRLRSAVYDSRIRNLGGVSASFGAGAIVKLAEHYRLTLGFGEDIWPDSAPDVSFHLALAYRGRP